MSAITYPAAAGASGIDTFRHAGASPSERHYTSIVNAATNADAPVTANLITLSPFAGGRGGKLDIIGVRQNAAGSAGALVRLGIYRAKSKTDLYPGVLVADSGTIAGDGANGAKTVAIDITLLADTLYWLAFWPNALASAGFRTHHAQPASQYGIWGMQNDFAVNQPWSGLSLVTAFGAWPTPFTAGATLLRNTNIPMVFIHFA